MLDATTLLAAILLIFYLYLLVRWQYVRRPWCYLMGAGCMAVYMIVMLIGLGSQTVMFVLQVIFLTGAFKGAVVACYGAQIPVWDKIVPPKPAEPPAEQEQSDPGA